MTILIPAFDLFPISTKHHTLIKHSSGQEWETSYFNCLLYVRKGVLLLPCSKIQYIKTVQNPCIIYKMEAKTQRAPFNNT